MLMSRIDAQAVTGFGLVISLFAMHRLFDQAVQSATCLQQAGDQLILCPGPPETTVWLVTVTITVALAIGFGAAIATPVQPVPARDIRER